MGIQAWHGYMPFSLYKENLMLLVSHLEGLASQLHQKHRRAFPLYIYTYFCVVCMYLLKRRQGVRWEGHVVEEVPKSVQEQSMCSR